MPPGERVGSERGCLLETESVGSHHEEVEDDSAEEDVVVSEAGEIDARGGGRGGHVEGRISQFGRCAFD